MFLKIVMAFHHTMWRTGKSWNNAAQVHENGTGDEGLGVWEETGEIAIDDFGEKKSFGSGRVVQDLKRTVCHSMGLVLPSRQFWKNKGTLEAGQERFQFEHQETLFSQSG